MSSNQNQNNSGSNSRPNGFNPNAPDIIQPYKSLITSGLFTAHVEFAEISTQFWMCPTDLTIGIDSTMKSGDKISAQRALDWAKAHDKVRSKSKSDKKTKEKDDVKASPLPKNSLDVRDFEGDGGKFLDRVKSVMGKISIATIKGRFISENIHGKTMKNSEIHSKFNKDKITFTSYWMECVNAPEIDHQYALLSLLCNKKKYTEIRERIEKDVSLIERLKLIKSFPVSELEDSLLSEKIEDDEGDDDDE
jgi:hypothetical protein